MSNLSEALSKYFSTFESLRDELQKSLEGWDTPVIVVFGPQNSGKSTLLERLAMIPMFPKGEGLCTRVPIRIRLRTGEDARPIISLYEKDTQEKELDRKTLQGDLLESITLMMNALIKEEESAGRGVRRDRLIQVELQAPTYPNIDLLDLPGMVVAPREGDHPKLPEESYQLVLDTIDELKGRAIYLAVRESGQDLNQSVTTKLLRERPEIKEFSLGVLTKCDNFAEKLILKELNASDEWALGYGYVATMNDPEGAEAHDLKKLGEAERAWFLGQRTEMFGADRVGCDVLVSKLAEAYHRYLEETWAPNTLAYLRREAEGHLKKISELGLPAGEASSEEMTSAVKAALSIILERARGDMLNVALNKLLKAPLWAGHMTPQGVGKVGDDGDCLSFSVSALSDLLHPGRGLKAQLEQGLSKQKAYLSKLPLQTLEPLLRGDHHEGEPLTEVRLARFPQLIQLSLKLADPQVVRSHFDRFFEGLFESHLKSTPLTYTEDVVCLRDLKGLRGRVITRALQSLSSWRLQGTLDVKLTQDERRFLLSEDDTTLTKRQAHQEALSALERSQRALVELFGEEVNKRSLELKEVTQVSQTCDGVRFFERVIPAPPNGEAFLMMETQVTQELWEAVMGSNPSKFQGPQKPVECVSWEDSVKFANALSRKLGFTPAYSGDDNNACFVEGADGFRLPLEAEWEFAARGGESFKYAGSNNLSEVGWYHQNSGSSTHDVGQLKPNAYGLYDMSGNVWEWCSDDYDNPGQHRSRADRHVRRGGGWGNDSEFCVVTCRRKGYRYSNLGLRLSRSAR